MGQTPQTEDRPDWFRPDVKEEIEPLVDIISIDCAIKVVALLPGVEKEDIRLRATEDALIILVDTSKRGYYKEVKLPAKVDPEKAETSYKNGVLEVNLPKKKGNANRVFSKFKLFLGNTERDYMV